MTPQERLAARRANEGLKALAALLNNLSVGIVIAGFLAPWVAGHPEPWWAATALIALAIGYHLCAQGVLRRFLKPEE